MRKAIFALTVFIAASVASYGKEYRNQDNVEWLKDKLNYVCMKQMQVIAGAMMK